MPSRIPLDEVVSQIMNDSDSGSEYEISDKEDVDFSPENASMAESPSSSDQEPEQEVVQQRGRGISRGRGRGRSISRGSRQTRGSSRGRSISRGSRQTRGASRGRARGRGTVDMRPAEFQWTNVDAYNDLFDTDWVREPHRVGILIDTSDFKPVDFFKHFFPDDVLDLMTTHTNLYASQFLENRNLEPYSRYHKWTDSSISEMQAYVALQIAMGINNKPEIPDYWSTYWLTANRFCDVMSRNRYQLLNTFLHFNDNELRVARGNEGYDALFKIRTILDITDPTYLNCYAPDKELSIDESMIKFKGWLFFRQYMPAKPVKWGIKTFALCESNTGYALRLLIYTGKGTFEVDRNSSLSITEQICLELLHGFEHKGYQVYLDNFYSSPKLFQELKLRGIGACGTVKPNRKYMPYDLQPAVLPLSKGDEPVFMRCEDQVTCAIMDTKRVHFLSTIHSDNTYEKTLRDRNADGGKRSVIKPVISESYNSHMNGVDVFDQKLGSYNYPHKCAKWYMSIFHRIREIALVNGYIMYHKSVPEGETPKTAVAFREAVIDGLLEGWDLCASKRGRPSLSEKPDRLTARHFPAQYENKKHRPNCIVCSEPGKRVQTRFYCRNCELAMCATDCFMLYHTQKDYRAAFRNKTTG